MEKYGNVEDAVLEACSGNVLEVCSNVIEICVDLTRICGVMWLHCGYL